MLAEARPAGDDEPGHLCLDEIREQPRAAGPERAVAATKTYVNQLGALALLAGHAGGEGRRFADGLRHTAELIESVLPELERAVPPARRLLLPTPGACS